MSTYVQYDYTPTLVSGYLNLRICDALPCPRG